MNRPEPAPNVVRHGVASPSAWRVAAQRAVHALLDEPLVFDDPYALPIMGPERAAALRADPFELNDPMSRGMRATLVVRARVAEDELARAVGAGLRQLVVLGAGLDTLALRAPALAPGLRVFEVDHPGTQAAKRAALAAAGLEMPAQSTFVLVDSEHAALFRALAAAGVRRDEPVFFNWLGVVMYLTAEASRETLRFVASCAPGSRVVFDYAIAFELMNPVERAISEAVAATLAAQGEPVVSRFDPAALATQLRALGFSELVDEGPSELNPRYLARRKDGLRVSSTMRMMTARV